MEDLEVNLFVIQRCNAYLSKLHSQKNKLRCTTGLLDIKNLWHNLFDSKNKMGWHNLNVFSESRI